MRGPQPGVGDDPDAVLRSPGRLAVLTAAGLLVALGLVFVVAGAFAPLGDEETRSWIPIAVGAWIAAFGGLGLLALAMPRARRAGTTLPPARTVTRDGRAGVELPLRPAGTVASITSAFLASALGIVVVVVADGLVLVALGVVVTLRMGAVGMIGLRRRSAIRLTPDGLTLPGVANPPTSLPWAHVHEVGVAGGWLPHLVVSHKGSGPATMRLTHQAWPPSALVEVLEHFRTHPRDRDTLVDPASLDRFRH